MAFPELERPLHPAHAQWSSNQFSCHIPIVLEFRERKGMMVYVGSRSRQTYTFVVELDCSGP